MRAREDAGASPRPRGSGGRRGAILALLLFLAVAGCAPEPAPPAPEGLPELVAAQLAAAARTVEGLSGALAPRSPAAELAGARWAAARGRIAEALPGVTLLAPEAARELEEELRLPGETGILPSLGPAPRSRADAAGDRERLQTLAMRLDALAVRCAAAPAPPRDLLLAAARSVCRERPEPADSATSAADRAARGTGRLEGVRALLTGARPGRAGPDPLEGLPPGPARRLRAALLEALDAQRALRATREARGKATARARRALLRLRDALTGNPALR